MKMIKIAPVAALALLAMTACSGNKSCDGACKGDKADKEELYTGVLPAADADGVRYTLHLDYDDDANDGDYKLIETYLQADSTSVGGFKDLRSFTSEGDFTVNKKGDVTYLRLVKDSKDSQQGSAESPMYFVVDSDSTIILTNADLQKGDNSKMNYTLRLSR